MYSNHDKEQEDDNYKGNYSEERRADTQNRRLINVQQERIPGNVSAVESGSYNVPRSFEKCQSELILRGAGERGANYEAYHLYGNITGLPVPRQVRVGDDLGIPSVASRHVRWNQLEPKMTRGQLSNDSEEEYFVDGNFFFNHLVRHREAEDYNMAEMLRERSRELQRRNLLSSRFKHQGNLEFPNSDRLSQSLPLEAPNTKRFYYSNINQEVAKTLTGQTKDQDIEFAGGLEIEIPPRRHAGLGGGGLLRESMSADRLLMVPSPHDNFGKQYFKMAGNSGSTSRIPSSHSAINYASRSSAHLESESHVKKSPLTKDFAFQSNSPISSGIEPVSNRYNVRTGRLEPSPDFAPRVPPKLYNRSESSPTSFTHPTDRLEHPQHRFHHNLPYDNRSHLAAGNWRQISNISHLPSPHQQQPKKPSPPPLASPPHTIPPHINSTIVSRKVVTWQDDVEPSQLTPSRRSSPAHHLGELQDDESASSADVSSTNFLLSDSIARNFVIDELHEVDQFALFEISNSKLSWGEGFMGSDWLDKTKQYKFVVLNRNEEVLFVGIEEESSLSDCISSPHRSSFSVRILDASGREVVNFRRLYSIKSKASFSSGKKTKYRLEVSTPEGHVIGNVEKTYDSDNYYILEDRTGEFMFLIQRSCICTCPLFWDYEFKILLPESGTEIGEISWSYLTAQNENFHGTEISFPMELNTISKVMLLGVCFLLNFSRWQSAYLDGIYYPWKKRDSYRMCPWRSPSGENKELAALLRSSPDVEGFQRNEEVIDEDIELETDHSAVSQQRNPTHVQ